MSANPFTNTPPAGCKPASCTCSCVVYVDTGRAVIASCGKCGTFLVVRGSVPKRPAEAPR